MSPPLLSEECKRWLLAEAEVQRQEEITALQLALTAALKRTPLEQLRKGLRDLCVAETPPDLLSAFDIAETRERGRAWSFTSPRRDWEHWHVRADHGNPGSRLEVSIANVDWDFIPDPWFGADR